MIRNFFSYVWSTSHFESTAVSFLFQLKLPWRFSNWRPWRPSWISDRNHFSYFWFTSRSDISYQVSPLLAFLFRRRSSKYIFLRWQPSWISDQNDFYNFWSTSPRHFLSSFESISHSVQDKQFEIDVQDGGHGHGGHLIYWSGTIFSCFGREYLGIHYENTPIQIYWKFYHHKDWKFSYEKSWNFSYFCSKYRLWVLVRTASLRRF